MSITISLAPDGKSFIGGTLHGHTFPLPADGSLVQVLMKLLREQQTPKKVPRQVGLDVDGLGLVLANWQKEEAEGQGFRPKLGTREAEVYGTSTRKNGKGRKQPAKLLDLQPLF